MTTNWKLYWWSVSKNRKQNFTRQGYMLSFNGHTLLLREGVTMLRSRDMISRSLVSFWCTICVPVSLIIPLIKIVMTFWHTFVCMSNMSNFSLKHSNKLLKKNKWLKLKLIYNYGSNECLSAEESLIWNIECKLLPKRKTDSGVSSWCNG